MSSRCHKTCTRKSNCEVSIQTLQRTLGSILRNRAHSRDICLLLLAPVAVLVVPLLVVGASTPRLQT